MIYVRPIIPLLMALICGIGMGVYFPDGIIWGYLTVFAAMGLICCRICKNQPAAFSPLVLFLGLGYLSMLPYAAPYLPSNHIIHYADSGRFTITGRIATRPVKKNDRWRFILKTERLKKGNDPFQVCGNLRVTAKHLSPDLENGARISFVSKIRSIKNFSNPSGFNYVRYMAFQNVRGTAYIGRNNVTVLQKTVENHGIRYLTGAIEDTRFNIAELIDAIPASMECRAILKAVIVGERSSISPLLRDAFNRAGAGHLLAISGLHIGMVATTAFMMFQFILVRFNPFLWNAATKKGAALLSLLPIWAYGLLAGMPPSAQRVTIMVTVFMAAYIWKREQDAINTLAVAAMLILAVFPPSLFSVSFQLSFAAVLTIIYGLSSSQYPAKIAKGTCCRLRRGLISFCRVSILATFGTLPLTMFYFNQVSLIGIVSNIILVPMIGSVVLPAGLISVCMYPFSMQTASLGLQIAAFVLERALDILHVLADTPFAAVVTVTPTVFEIICYYLLLWIWMAWGKKFAFINSKDTSAISDAATAKSSRTFVFPGCVSFKVPYRVIAAVAGLAICADAIFWMHQRFWHDDLKITVMDVGQGNAALLEMPGGESMLVDGGGFYDRSVFDVGEKIIAPFLRRKKIMTINTVVLTHPDSDHLNGLLYIVEHFHVDRIWTNSQVVNTVAYKELINIAAEKNIRLSDFNELERHHTIRNVGIRILYPSRDYADKIQRERWRDSNNNSLVLKIHFGNHSILFTGDIKKPAEEELVAMAGDDLKSDVLIAPHHGSRSSSTKIFLNAVRPEIVIVSCGRMNRFHFPHPSVLKRYRRQGCTVLRTDREGAIILSSAGKVLKVTPFLSNNDCYLAGRTEK